MGLDGDGPELFEGQPSEKEDAVGELLVADELTQTVGLVAFAGNDEEAFGQMVHGVDHGFDAPT